jgi:hypothetical protein
VVAVIEFTMFDGSWGRFLLETHGRVPLRMNALYFDLWHWIYGHPYKFTGIFVVALTGIATLVLAINAVLQTKNNRNELANNEIQLKINKEQLALDRIRYNREFLGAIYGRGMEAFSETVENLEVWQNGIKNMAATGTSFTPASVSINQIVRTRQKALDFGKEMKVYPNDKIQPHYEAFILLLNEIMDKFNSLYIPANQAQGASFLGQVISEADLLIDSIKQTNAEFESVIISELNSTK